MGRAEDCQGNAYIRYWHDIVGPKGDIYSYGTTAQEATDTAIKLANEQHNFWQLGALERVKKLLDASRGKRHIYTNDLQIILDGLYENDC